jgi:hypothetical protein
MQSMSWFVRLLSSRLPDQASLRCGHLETYEGWVTGLVSPDLAYLKAEMLARKRWAAHRKKRHYEG